MGTYVNSNKGYEFFKSMHNTKKYFIDKSSVIHEFNKLLNNDMNCACITKPRRSGKTFIAALIITYYSRSRKDEFKRMFDTLEISGNKITNFNESSNTSNILNDINTEYYEKEEEYEITQINISNNEIYENTNQNKSMETPKVSKEVKIKLENLRILKKNIKRRKENTL